MKCRTPETRIELVQRYRLRPVTHVRLLAGQKKRSCTGDMLTDAYYCFAYEAMQGAEKGSFYCGSHAARHLLELTGHAPLPLFNPLKAVDSGNGAGAGSGAGTGQGGGARKAWHPAAKQLSNAINLLVVCWNSPPGPALTAIQEELENTTDRAPLLRQVKAINTVISKDIKKRTLIKMLDDLSAGNDIKSYDFDLLNEILNQESVVSHFG
ncbi:hypothetical protein [Alcaligenes sp. SDU_A2]|uniref:hypothetical protein n=1 Tax=Alcaligenes sp. SDU_A2 TaxID=3136634 RepID=UPI00311D87BD